MPIRYNEGAENINRKRRRRGIYSAPQSRAEFSDVDAAFEGFMDYFYGVRNVYLCVTHFFVCVSVCVIIFMELLLFLVCMCVCQPYDDELICYFLIRLTNLVYGLLCLCFFVCCRPEFDVNKKNE